jgi:acyl-CoA reductase-like NAD-dependent aldehyde dehydrogenase
MLELKQIIGGKFVPSKSGKTYDRLDPFTGKVATRAPASGLDDVKAAVAAAHAAFPAWSKTGPGERRALLMKAADILASKGDEFAKIMVEETGGTAPWAGFNTMLAAGILREAAGMTTQIQGEIIPSDKPGTLSMAVRQAAGASASRHGMPRSFSAPAPLPWRSPAATLSFSRRRKPAPACTC